MNADGIDDDVSYRYVVALLMDWCNEEPAYLAELWRRIKLGEGSSLHPPLPPTIAESLSLNKLSRLLNMLYHDGRLNREEVWDGGIIGRRYRQMRIMSVKCHYTPTFSCDADFEPFKLYYTENSEPLLPAKKELISRLMMIGDKCWQIAEDVLYEVCKDVWGYRDRHGAINVVRAKRGSSAGDVVVHSAQKIFEISIRYEVPITQEYVDAKRAWRTDEDLDDYDLIIIGNAIDSSVWSRYRHPLHERGEMTDWIRVHKMRIDGFPLFWNFWGYSPDFVIVRRKIAKITRKALRSELLRIVRIYH